MTLKPPAALDASLVAEFNRIRLDHQRATRQATAQTVLGPSVIRVFRPGTRDKLIAVLAGLPVDDLRGLNSQEDYRTWFGRQLRTVATALEELNSANGRVQPGLKWGHATKILCLFVAGIVEGSRYFEDRDTLRIRLWLYTPIDSRIIRRLRDLGLEPGFSQIREIDSFTKFMDVQQVLGEVASRVGVPRIWFDDNWAASGERASDMSLSTRSANG